MKFGLYAEPSTIPVLNTAEQTLGRRIDVGMVYRDSSLPPQQDWMATWLSGMRLSGRAPLVTWEPWQMPLAEIAAGKHDVLIREFAAGLKAVSPTYLRPAHEMNGDWYPWGQSADYVAAWRHLRYIFKTAAPNVRFVWCPNVMWDGAPPAVSFDHYWPGQAYVDLLGLDAYNFGTRDPGFSWQSFTHLLDQANSYGRLHTLARTKTIWLCETACAPEGGDKAAWVKDMFVQAPSFKQLGAVVWFDKLKERDWRAEPVAEAFRP